MLLSENIVRAIDCAAAAHSGQTRKNNDRLPYIIHPCRVGFVLAALGCREEVVIAGILHDVIEDTDVTAEEIEESFGKEVRIFVERLSDKPNLSFKERKSAQVKKYSNAPEEIKLIKAGDFLDNIRSTALALRTDGEVLWGRLAHAKEDYIREQSKLLDALRKNWKHPILDDIEVYLREIAEYRP